MVGKVVGDRQFEAVGGVVDRLQVKTVYAYLHVLTA